jgi:adenosine deaminase
VNEAERKVRAIRGRLLSFLRAPRGAGDAQSHRYIEDGIVLAKSLTAHAGEEGPAAYVWEALDALGVARIDHGNHSPDDEALVGRLARERIALTVCPLSNLRLRVIDDLSRHPLRHMMDKGLHVTVNSDDPAYFGGYVNENYRAVSCALGLRRDEIAATVRNGIEASLMTAAEKADALAEVDRVLAETA